MKFERMKKEMKKSPKDTNEERMKSEENAPKLIKHDKRGRNEEQIDPSAQSKKKKLATIEDTELSEKDYQDNQIQTKSSAVKTSGGPKQEPEMALTSCDTNAVKTSGKPKQDPEMPPGTVACSTKNTSVKPQCVVEDVLELDMP